MSYILPQDFDDSEPISDVLGDLGIDQEGTTQEGWDG